MIESSDACVHALHPEMSKAKLKILQWKEMESGHAIAR